MEEFKYVIGFFLNRNEHTFDLSKIDEFAKFIAECFKTKFLKFGFIYRKNNRAIDKFLKYTPTNLKKLFAINPQELSLINFEKFKEKVDFQNTELSLKMNLLSDEYFPITIKIIIDPILVMESFEINKIISIMEKMNELDFETESGVVFVMERNKMPMFFLSGVGTPGLTQEEREVVRALSHNIRNIRKQIWDVFWANVIKKDLLTSDILQEISSIVSKENIIEAGDKYIIRLPVEPEEYLENGENLKSDLRKIFRKKGLLMYK